MNLFSIETYIFIFPAVIIGFTFHEFAHAFVADRLGDPTPREQGRLTIDIRKHVDLWGLLALLIFQFGWGRPVETNSRYLKNPKVGTVLISLAGPLMNFIISFITFVTFFKVSGVASEQVSTLIYFIAYINAQLGVFNLLPIPPLDGSKIITIFMSPQTYFKYMQFQAVYDMQLTIGLFILLYLGILNISAKFAVNLISVPASALANILPF